MVFGEAQATSSGFGQFVRSPFGGVVASLGPRHAAKGNQAPEDMVVVGIYIFHFFAYCGDKWWTSKHLSATICKKKKKNISPFQRQPSLPQGT